MKRVFMVGAVAALCGVLALFTSNTPINGQSKAAGTPVLQVGRPLQPAHMTSSQVLQALKKNGVTLFPYASGVTVRYGSFAPHFQAPVPHAGYWSVTLTGLYKDERGHDLLVGAGDPHARHLPVFHTVTFIINDQTGKVIEDAFGP